MCVCVSAHVCVCAPPKPPPTVTDARLFMCEVWEEWLVGRWGACEKGGVCVVCCGWVWAVVECEELHLSDCADMRVNVFAYTGICVRTCPHLRVLYRFNCTGSQIRTCYQDSYTRQPKPAVPQPEHNRWGGCGSGSRANDELIVATEVTIAGYSLFRIMTQSRRLMPLR